MRQIDRVLAEHLAKPQGKDSPQIQRGETARQATQGLSTF